MFFRVGFAISIPFAAAAAVTTLHSTPSLFFWRRRRSFLLAASGRQTTHKQAGRQTGSLALPLKFSVNTEQILFAYVRLLAV